MMEIEDQREFLFKRMTAEARGFGLEIEEALSARKRPWGAYLRFSEASLPAFFSAYWADVQLNRDLGAHRLDPKILMVAPGARLSLQYHHRRQEYWRVLVGPVKIVLGPDGTSLQERTYYSGDLVTIPQGYWHRIAASNGWAVIAEIWEHTVEGQPSNEDDIVRVEDDYSRSESSAAPA